MGILLIAEKTQYSRKNIKSFFGWWRIRCFCISLASSRSQSQVYGFLQLNSQQSVCLYESSTELNYVLEHWVQRNTTVFLEGVFPVVIGNLLLWFGKEAMSTMPFVIRSSEKWWAFCFTARVLHDLTWRLKDKDGTTQAENEWERKDFSRWLKGSWRKTESQRKHQVF